MPKPEAKMVLGTTISIASPQPSRWYRGTNAGKNTDPIRSVRISDHMYATIQEACNILGMTKNEFIRWCAYMSANETIRQWREYEKTLPPLPKPVAKPSPLTLSKPTRISKL